MKRSILLILALVACSDPIEPVTERCTLLAGERVLLRSDGTFTGEFKSGEQEGRWEEWNDLIAFYPRVGFAWAVEPQRLRDCD